MGLKAAKQVTYYYGFVIIVLLMVAGLLFYNIQIRESDFASNQHSLMQSSVTSAANEISLSVKELRRLVGLFAEQNESVLQQIIDHPDDLDAIAALNELVGKYFPNYHAVTVADEHGDVLLDDEQGFVGNMCRTDIKGFVKDAHKPHVYVHPSGKGYHFDVINSWGDGKVLFVSFKLEEIARLLGDSELPEHELFLLKQDALNKIEIASSGGSNQLLRASVLSAEDISRIGYSKNVDGTLWRLIDLPSKNLFNDRYQQIWVENITILVVFTIMLLLMLMLLIREYKRNQLAQAQLVQSSKMASLGQMVAGIAHEMNTPLGYVKSNVEFVGEQLSELKGLSNKCSLLHQLLNDKQSAPAELRKGMDSFFKMLHKLNEEEVLDDSLNLIKDSDYGLNQISELVQGLKDFSRMDGKAAIDFNLNEGLDSTLNIAQNVLTDQIEVVKHYSDIPEVECAASQINQVFLNLITNAAQAMNGSGIITLETGFDGNNVYAKVIDEGKGISKKDMALIFDPFFTTKEVGEGTGLGLSISYKIIEDHGGRLEVKSTEGQGAEFLVVLPVSEK